MFKVGVWEPTTLKWWYSKETNIDLNPNFQRKGRLWSQTDKAFLVDSVINKYDIPKIYIADFTWGYGKLNKKKLPYAIIDGKQRLEALFDFFRGDVVLDNNFRFQENPELKLGGLGYADLRKNYPEIADTFENYPLTAMRVVTDEPDKINELFIRLNRSKPLTGAEIRNAMSGPVPDLIRSLVSHELFTSNIRFPSNRGQDKNAAAKLLLFENGEKPCETKKKNLDDFAVKAKRASRSDKNQLELASRRVVDILDRLAEIFLPKDVLLGSPGLLPVYYWFVRLQKLDEDLSIREFLVEFENARKQNRLSQKGRITVDKELNEYDLFNRSTNDLTSHQERVRILSERFDSYLKRKKSHEQRGK